MQIPLSIESTLPAYLIICVVVKETEGSYTGLGFHPHHSEASEGGGEELAACDAAQTSRRLRWVTTYGGGTLPSPCCSFLLRLLWLAIV
ncbi:hypothetical protein CTKA_02583 [Chthonomonas calidirosea]|uniref:Uncharacterized protein n=1 Tax=Chthonomonas calidirosea (strain DSM 23976 / ICMP 18418 / T49) TaxID=1303518 RepID=S0EUJ7_CHTCT|nr:hypothetical protein CCALI_01517 [Chthonomonas calidirosea T49]CEK20582.1 hypothetical protein CTKA_02583 [Chthonomonas calidirosea]